MSEPLTNEERLVAAFEAIASDESKTISQVVDEFIAGYEEVVDDD